VEQRRARCFGLMASRESIYRCCSHVSAQASSSGHVVLGGITRAFTLPSTCSDRVQKSFHQAAGCNLVHAKLTAQCPRRVCLPETAWRTVLGPRCSCKPSSTWLETHDAHRAGICRRVWYVRSTFHRLYPLSS
jgi:hypothetical protein